MTSSSSGIRYDELPVGPDGLPDSLAPIGNVIVAPDSRDAIRKSINQHWDIAESSRPFAGLMSLLKIARLCW